LPSEILPHWKFKTPEIAEQSAAAIYSLYLNYKAQDDFVGMDMARKFLQNRRKYEQITSSDR
jgi:Domain of unknown function (DUF4385)